MKNFRRGGEVFRPLRSIDDCRERYCPKRDVGDVPPTKTAAPG
jgi:hypothetical protein